MVQRLFRRLSTPGAVSPPVVFIASIAAMTMLFVLDQITPHDVRLYLLYSFPLAAIALHCERASAIAAGLVLSIVFQLATFFIDAVPSLPLTTDALVAISSAVLTIALARATRENHLAAVNLATTDWLTGLHNRRSFESIADLEIRRQKRYGGVFSLAVIDLDSFKHLNDSKGHHVGDSALQILADVLRDHTRQTDTIARLGGDEFAILMPSTGEPECSSLCQQLCVTIAGRMTAVGFATTASIGCSAFQRAPESVSHALKEVDKAMYAAKSGGKNCAVSV